MNNQSNKTRFNISDASRISGKGRSTIQRALKSGRLSSIPGPGGAKLIDASELQRVYGDDCDFSLARSGSSGSTNGRGEADAVTHEKLEAIQQQLDTLKEERRREREQFQSQIDHLQDSLKLAQEGHNNATKLLEDRSPGVGEEASSILEIERRLNQQQSLIEDQLPKVRENAKTEAIKELRDLPWWSALSRLVAS